MKNCMIIIVALLVFSGCGGSKKEKTVIKIGEIEITAREFNQSFDSATVETKEKITRQDFLDRLIARKLILKEAESMGLDKDPQFLQSIQLFWEQSLLKLVLSRKMKELSLATGVNEDEINQYYKTNKEAFFSDKQLSAVRDQIKWLLFKAKQSKAMQDWIDSLKNETKLEIDYTLLKIKEPAKEEE